MIGRRSSIRCVTLLLGLACLLAGCVSTQDRYEEAQALTNEGRYAEAARYYVRVLRDEPDWPNAREELEPVGQRAIDRLLADAERAAEEERYEAAVAALDELDAVRADIESVGVVVSVPDNYAAFHRETVRAAADMLIAEARSAEEAGDWPAADAAYEEARQYVQTEERRLVLDEAQAHVALRWGEDEMAHQRFRAAYAQADRVFALVGSEHHMAADAEAMQVEAVERGMRLVAFLPLGHTQEAVAVAPELFVPDLNDVLQYDYWSAPPLFIASTDPVEARRMVRRLGTRHPVLTGSEAAVAGRALGADLVVAGELTAFVRTEDDLEEDVHPTRLRVRGRTGDGPAWIDTSYVLQTFDLELEATVEYRLVDARTGYILDRGEEAVQYEGERQRGRFPGDYRQLDLSGSELSLFDSDDQHAAERALQHQLIDRLAADVADEVFARVLRHIE